MVAAVNLTQDGVTFCTQQIVDLLLKMDHFLNKEHVNEAVNCLLQWTTTVNYIQYRKITWDHVTTNMNIVQPYQDYIYHNDYD